MTDDSGLDPAPEGHEVIGGGLEQGPKGDTAELVTGSGGNLDGEPADAMDEGSSPVPSAEVPPAPFPAPDNAIDAPVGSSSPEWVLPPSRVRRRLPRPGRWVLVPALLMVVGVVVALVAVAQASAAVLVGAGLLLLAGVVSATVLARRNLQQPRRRVAAIAGAVVLALVVLVPASMNVDPCTRLGRDADLSGCDLSDRELVSEDLQGADLSGADLGGSDLTGADLRGADLSGTSLRGSDLSGALLANATAREADLHEAILEDAALAGSDLTGANIAAVSAQHADLSDANLTEVNLTGADLTGATMGNADLSDADLTEAVLDSADLSDADLSGATLTSSDLSSASLGNADLATADLSRANLIGASAPGADFEGAHLTGARLGFNEFVGATGITDEGLAAALGVRQAALPSVTAQRRIVFDHYATILDAVTPVRDGQGVPEARAYARSNAFHPAIVLDAEGFGAASWLADVRDRWAPTGIRFAELVVVVDPEREETVDMCFGYVFDDGSPAPPIRRSVTSVTVRVLRAHDAHLVDERTFRGSDPRPCRNREYLDRFAPEVHGGRPNLDGEAQPWLADLVNPPAEQSA